MPVLTVTNEGGRIRAHYGATMRRGSVKEGQRDALLAPPCCTADPELPLPPALAAGSEAPSAIQGPASARTSISQSFGKLLQPLMSGRSRDGGSEWAAQLSARGSGTPTAAGVGMQRTRTLQLSPEKQQHQQGSQARALASDSAAAGGSKRARDGSAKVPVLVLDENASSVTKGSELSLDSSQPLMESYAAR